MVDGMKGRRIYPNADGQLWPIESGDYGYDERGVWYVMPPGTDLLADVTKHNVTEHEDDTITVTPSILVSDHEHRWHGYLTRGEWSEC